MTSEFATWLTLGWRRVEEYRLQRKSEASKSLDDEVGEIFHNGEDVLQAVEQSHRGVINAIEKRRPDDSITPQVLSKTVRIMLKDASQRVPINNLRLLAQNIIKEANSKLHETNAGLDPDPAPSSSSDHSIVGDEERPWEEWPLASALDWRRCKMKMARFGLGFKKLKIPDDHVGDLCQLEDMHHVRSTRSGSAATNVCLDIPNRHVRNNGEPQELDRECYGSFILCCKAFETPWNICRKDNFSRTLGIQEN